jgi:hypothetical protein
MSAAAGEVRGWALGSVASAYVLTVLAMIYFLCRRVMWRKEQYGLKYQATQVGPRQRCVPAATAQYSSVWRACT